MIITVTTSTVTTMLGPSDWFLISSQPAMELNAAVGIPAVASLIAFLITKELANSTNHTSSMRVARIARFLNVAILPLAISFAVIVAVKAIGIAY